MFTEYVEVVQMTRDEAIELLGLNDITDDEMLNMAFGRGQEFFNGFIATWGELSPAVVSRFCWNQEIKRKLAAVGRGEKENLPTPTEIALSDFSPFVGMDDAPDGTVYIGQDNQKNGSSLLHTLMKNEGYANRTFIPKHFTAHLREQNQSWSQARNDAFIAGITGAKDKPPVEISSHFANNFNAGGTIYTASRPQQAIHSGTEKEIIDLINGGYNSFENVDGVKTLQYIEDNPAIAIQYPQPVWRRRRQG